MAPESNVSELRRPPIRQSTIVRSSVEHTFEVFVREIGSWWPLQPFSIGKDRIREVTFERTLGGRVFETWDDGTIREWGRVLHWKPPSGFAMTWNVTGTPTEVELRFTSEDVDSTRVDLEHRGWEKLTEAQLTEACALPGGYLGGSFNEGWTRILAQLTSAAEEGHR
ncbi:MAG: activator of Hsp90 ATPase 1 family protein [Microbacteriaceae bacterium]|nr:activator of Hsp90 ATPase 1 family protein [Microbacteriaceae bacterium]